MKKILNISVFLEYQNIKIFLQRGYTPNWSEEVFVIKKVKNTVSWTYFINDLNVEEIVGTFYQEKLQKPNQKEFRVEKVIMRKDNNLYVKLKGYNYSFNSCIDKKRHVFPKPKPLRAKCES